MAMDPKGTWNELKIDPAAIEKQKQQFRAIEDSYAMQGDGPPSTSTFMPDYFSAIETNWADASGKVVKVGKNKDLLAGMNVHSRMDKLPDGSYALYRDDPSRSGGRKFAVAKYKLDEANNKFVRTSTWFPVTEYKANPVKAILPAVAMMANLAFPGLGAALGGAIGLSGTAASVAGSAAIGAGSSAAAGARGTDILKGAAVGAVGAGLPAVPGFTGLDPMWQRALTGGAKSLLSSGGDLKAGLVGAATGAAGQNPASSLIANFLRQQLLQTIVGPQPPRKG